MNGYIGWMIAWAAFLLICCAAVCILVKRRCERRLETAYQEMLQKLDRAIGGELSEPAYDESMDAAVAERLNRVIQISGMNRERAEQERDTVKSLISDISHQIRTPLSNIMLYSGLLREQAPDQKTRLLADKIQNQSEKLEFFMKELVRSSYAEQEMISIHPELTDVEEIINTACQAVELASLKKKITIVQGETDAVCYADKKWTIEALGNVLDNAVKYSPEHSRVTVTVLPYESFLCIQVSDQGIGIREEERGKVFERFYRSRDVSGEPGFGIGLYLVREILSRQGGYVKINSEPGRGTAVQLYLSRRAV